MPQASRKMLPKEGIKQKEQGHEHQRPARSPTRDLKNQYDGRRPYNPVLLRQKIDEAKPAFKIIAV